MKYQTTQPSGKLKGYVRFFWTLEGEVIQAQPYIHRTLASYRPELIFHYKGAFDELTFDNQLSKSFLTGIHAQTKNFRRFIIRENFGIFGVCFEPFAIPAIFKLPSTAIADELPDLSILLGRDGAALEEKIMLAPGNHARIAVVTSFLEHRLTDIKRPEIIHATKMIYKKKGQLNLKELADSSCLSQRQFERKFKETMGFAPKLFSRIVRFNALLSENKRGYGSLTAVAYDYGYYDQAHFIHDFREFSGYNPLAYFSGRAPEIFNVATIEM